MTLGLKGYRARKAPTFEMMAVIQFVLVIGAFTAWWLIRTRAFLRAPIGPYGEYYVHNWSFQGMVGILYLVGLLAFTTFLIILERWIFGLFFDDERRRVSKSRRSM